MRLRVDGIKYLMKHKHPDLEESEYDVLGAICLPKEMDDFAFL